MAFSCPCRPQTTSGTLDLEKDFQRPQVSGQYVFGAAAEASVVNAVDVDASLVLLSHRSPASQERAAKQLCQYIISAWHEMSTEAFGRHQGKLYQRIFSRLRGSDIHGRLGAVAILSELVQTETPFAESELDKVSNNLSDALRTNSDRHVLVAVSRALGHIIRLNTTPNVDFIEFLINRGIEWLHEERNHQRLAACLVLREMALNAPAAFYVKISAVFDGITPLLVGDDCDIRDAASNVLSVCLSAMAQHGGHFYLRWHCRCFDMIINGLKNTHERSEPKTHGALLMASVMLKCSRNFIIPRFKELCDAIMNYTQIKKNPSNLIMIQITEILPQVANVFLDAFAETYLSKALEYLTHGCTVPELRDISFLSLGQLSLVIPHHLPLHLEQVITVVKEGLSPNYRRTGFKSQSTNALTCLANLVMALGSEMGVYIADLTPAMFCEGLSPSLIDTLVVISKSLPAHKAPLQKRLLSELSLILYGKSYIPPGKVAPWVQKEMEQEIIRQASFQSSNSKTHSSLHSSRSNAPYFSGSGWELLLGYEEIEPSAQSIDPTSLQSGKTRGKWARETNCKTFISTASASQGEELLVLALHTLGGYKIGWSGICLLPFVKNCVVEKYIKHPSLHVRKEAVLCCCRLLVEPASSGLVVGPTVEAIEGILQHLLQVVVADPEPGIRKALICALDPQFDRFLRQSHHLEILFLFVGDADFTIRLESISLLGRLAFLNPAYILPSLRSTFLHLIVELQYNTMDTNAQIEATCMICRFFMARSLHQLVLPLLDTLVSVLQFSAQSPQLATASLEALEGLCVVAKGGIAAYVDKLMPILFESMADRSCVTKREVGLRTFGRFITACEYVGHRYVDYPLLLPGVTALLRDGTLSFMPWSLRREALRTLGSLGALEPYLYHQIESKDKQQWNNATSGAGYTFTHRFVVGSEAYKNVASETSSGFVQNSKKEESKLEDERGVGEIESLPMDRTAEPAANVVVVKDYFCMYGIKERWADKGTPAVMSASCAIWEQYTPHSQPYAESPQATCTVEIKDSYQTVAIKVLMDMLGDPNLDVHHKIVLIAIGTIFKSLGLRCVDLLGDVIPNMIHVGRNCEPGLRGVLLHQLGQLAGIVTIHLRPFLPELFELIIDYWDDYLEQVVLLMVKMVTNLRETFAPYAPRLLPNILQSIAPPSFLIYELSSLSKGRVPRSPETLKSACVASRRKLVAVLKSFHVIHPVMNQYVHVIIPALIKLITAIANTGVSLQSTKLLKVCVSSLGSVISYGLLMQHRSDAAQLVSPLAHVMDIWTCQESSSGNGGGSSASSSSELQDAILEVLCSISVQLGPRYLPFHDHIIAQRLRLLYQHRDAKMVQQYLDIITVIKESASGSQKTPMSISASQGGCTMALLGLLGESARNYLGTYEVSEQGERSSLRVAAAGSALQPAHSSPPTHPVNLHNLRIAWDVTQRKTYEDWMTWMICFRLVLLRESPNPALRACGALAQAYPPIGKRLFNPAFMSCWLELGRNQDDLILALETLFKSPGVPIEIIHDILNLAEFMEREVNPLPIDISVLSKHACRCNAYAKALHFKETEFRNNPAGCIEDLIIINKKLGHVDAAKGVIAYARNYLKPAITVEESWLAELGQWRDALGIFKGKVEKQESDPSYVTSVLGCMRCMDALGDWDEIVELYDESWPKLKGSDENCCRQIEIIAARSAWVLRDWERFSRQVKTMEGSLVDKSYFHAVLAIHERDFERCELHVDVARRRLENEFTSRLMESYSRAYSGMVSIQLLSELEEIMEYLKSIEHEKNTEAKWPESGGGGEQPVGEAEIMRLGLISRWNQRLECAAPNERVWRHILTLHSLILEPTDDIQNWLHLARLCQQNGNFSLSHKVLERQLQCPVAELSSSVAGGIVRQNIDSSSSRSELKPEVLLSPPQQGIKPLLRLAYLEHKWAAGEGDRQQIITELRILTDTIHVSEVDLKVHCLLRLGQWELKSRSTQELSNDTLRNVASKYELATGLQKDNYQAWQRWAIINLRMAEHQICSDPSESPSKTGGGVDDIESRDKLDENVASGEVVTEGGSNSRDHSLTTQYIVNATEGFLRTIALGRYHESAFVQQSMLHLISILFTRGHIPEVHAALSDGLATSPLDSWLGVLPQLMARINIKNEGSRAVLHSLLDRLGRHHPQALVYPMCVPLKSPRADRREAAARLLANLHHFYTQLMKDALLVSDELINVAILWHEHCRESLDEASRRYFRSGDIHGMLAVLLPMHSMLQSGAKTKKEEKFLDRYGEHLEAAYKCLLRYIGIMKLEGLQLPANTTCPPISPAQENQQQQQNKNNAEITLVEAWNIYYMVFRDINRHLSQMGTLELRHVSPQLLAARDLNVVVPGSYRIPGSGVRIQSFHPAVRLISSKQRPRKVIMRGEDGKDYCFILKGHEDLRQDERAMQLFGQVNALLAFAQQTKYELFIQRYCVIPLSHNAGLLGWLSNTDTLHTLIREYRESHKIMLDAEHRIMVEATRPCEYDSLTTMQKVEIFRQALETTPGHDLHRIVWLRSANSEAWLERRTNFTRSLAVMSMAGYILGLGDRHPSNLLLDRVSANIIHIDFGDCFEIAIHRNKFPEKVPFRLTRMLCNAMEVCGVEGTYRATCERVMVVLRKSSDSLLAMLEAFVHDPLISWRFLDGCMKEEDIEGREDDNIAGDSNKEGNLRPPSPPSSQCRQQQRPKEEGGSSFVYENMIANGRVTGVTSGGDGIGPLHSDNTSQSTTNGNLEQFIIPDAAAPVCNKSRNSNPSIPLQSTECPLPLANSGNDRAEVRRSLGNARRIGDDVVVVEQGGNDDKKQTSSGHLNNKFDDEGAGTRTTNTHEHTNVPSQIYGGENESQIISSDDPTTIVTPVPLRTVGDVISYKERMYLSMEQISKSLVVHPEQSVEPRSVRSNIQSELGDGMDVTREGSIDSESNMSLAATGKVGKRKAPPPGAFEERSLKIVSRVQDKLSGKDFGNTEPFTVEEQVDRLISEATSTENLSQLFSGWCSFW